MLLEQGHKMLKSAVKFRMVDFLSQPEMNTVSQYLWCGDFHPSSIWSMLWLLLLILTNLMLIPVFALLPFLDGFIGREFKGKSDFFSDRLRLQISAILLVRMQSHTHSPH